MSHMFIVSLVFPCIWASCVFPSYPTRIREPRLQSVRPHWLFSHCNVVMMHSEQLLGDMCEVMGEESINPCGLAWEAQAAKD